MKTRLFVFIACIGIGAGILTGCLKGNDPTEDEDPDGNGNSTEVKDPVRGTGTASDPFIITTAQQLSDLRNLTAEYAGTHFKLGNDIDVSSFSEKTWGAEGWNPIGSSTNRFLGHLDGDGHKVTGLWINRSTGYAGLFGSIDTDGALINIGVLTDEKRGVVNTNTSSSNCIGGLVGLNDGSIINCYATGSVIGNMYAGGLAGLNNGSIMNSYANVTGSVTGIASTGGFAGRNVGSITNCYATGSVIGNMYVGGFTGSNGGSIINCYAAGNVTGKTEVGAFLGVNRSSITNCYYLSNSIRGVGMQYDEASGTATGMSGQMKTQSAFTGFDFTTIWSINEGASFPYLRDIEENVTNPPGR